MVCCWVALALGCSYKTLKFFFDGVPEPQKKKQAVRAGATAPENAGTAVRAAYYEHAPYAARECDSCHDRNRTNALVTSKEQLCFNCHDLQLNQKYVHGPIASGGCLVCHDPHSSRYAFLLVSEPSTFCFHCHDPNAIPKDEPHTRTDVQCTLCHDAHMSDKKYLLK